MTKANQDGLREALWKLAREVGGTVPGVWDKANKLLVGSVDMHMHPSPFAEEARLDAFEAAVQAKEAGMRAIVLKNHHYCSAPLAEIISKLVPDVTVIGAVCIDNGSTGGLNVDIIRHRALIGARVLWFPTIDAPRLNKLRGRPGGISILDAEGKVQPVVIEILEIAKQYNMVVCNGHLSFRESLKLYEEANRLSIIKLVATHVLFGPHPDVYPPLSLDQQKQLVEMGVYLEHCYTNANVYADFENFTEHVRAVGVQSCIISTDAGQVTHPTPVDCMRLFITKLLVHGFSEQEVETMAKINPSKLLDL